MTRLPTGKTRLDLVRDAAASAQANPGLNIKRGRMVVGLDRLTEDPRNERRTFAGMDELVASIRQVGLVEPITVTAEPDGVLRIVTGHRRFRAAKAAGLAQVEVIVRDPEDERTRRMKSVISNVQRENVNAFEMAEALQAIIEDGFAHDQSDLARSIGKTKQWVAELLAVLKLPKTMIEQIRQQPISYDAAARIARVKDTSLQRELIDFAATGASGRAIRRLVEERKGKSNQSAATALAKPKRVFRTPHRVTIIVQADTSDLRHHDVLAGLRDALDQATTFMN